jgi:hypothetical protein
MKILRIILIALSLYCSAEAAYSLTAMGGKINMYRMDPNGVVQVMFQNPSYQNAACSTRLNTLSFNINTSIGRTKLALVISAHSAGLTMLAYGTGFCSNTFELWGAPDITEDLGLIMITN